MLAEHVARAGAARFAVERVGADGVERGLAFDHLEAVGGDEERLGGRVVAVVGAADPLDEALDVLRRADLDHQIDVAPVDARGRASRCRRRRAARPRPSPLPPARAVRGRGEPWWMPMGRSSVVREPEVVEEELGLGAGVVEDQRGAVARDLVQDRGDGVAAAAAGPRGRRRRFPACEMSGSGPGSACRMRGVGARGSGRGRAGLRPWRRGRCGGGRGSGSAGGRAGASSWSPRLDSASAWISSTMTRCRPGEDAGGVFVAEEEGEAFGRGQQDMRRVGALAAALGVGGVAGAVLDPDRQARAFDGRARGCGGCRR